MSEIAIEPGQCWEDHDGLCRYVVEVKPASGRFLSRVRWRRPGAYADRIHDDPLPTFLTRVKKLDLLNMVCPAPALQNNGMAEVEK